MDGPQEQTDIVSLLTFIRGGRIDNWYQSGICSSTLPAVNWIRDLGISPWLVFVAATGIFKACPVDTTVEMTR